MPEWPTAPTTCGRESKRRFELEMILGVTEAESQGPDWKQSRGETTVRPDFEAEQGKSLFLTTVCPA